MTSDNFKEAIDRLEGLFIMAEIKIATSEIWEDIDLQCGIIHERKLPTGHSATNAPRLIQGQAQRYARLRRLASHGRCDGAACFGCPT